MALQRPIYDLVLLLDPTIDEDRRTKILDDVEHMIGDRRGEIVSAHDWGVRPMVYEVRKHAEAEYHLLQFHATNELLEAFDHSLKITDGILRHRVIKLRPGTPAPPDMTPGAHLGHEDEHAVGGELEHEPAEA